MSYPRELLALERHAFAVLQAMPSLKAAHDTYDKGPQLVQAIESIEAEYGIGLA